MEIALVDDDATQRALLAALVESGAHRPHAFASGDALLDALDASAFDLLLLDWMMPGVGGEDVLREVRARRGASLPVIVVTACGDEADLVLALGAGADDYVVKPPKRRELLARIDAVARRVHGPRAAPVRFGPYEIDVERRAVRVDGRTVALTGKEFDVAAHLFRRPGELVTRDQLRTCAWGDVALADSRTVDTHVSRVRRKLGLDGAGGFTLQAVYGFGYRLTAAAR